MPCGEHKHKIETVPTLKDISGKEMRGQNITGRKGRMWEAHDEGVWRDSWGPRGPEIPPSWELGFLPKDTKLKNKSGFQGQATHRQVWGHISGNIFMEEIEFAISAWDNIWFKSLTDLSHSFPFPIHSLKFTQSTRCWIFFFHMFVDVRHCVKS